MSRRYDLRDRIEQLESVEGDGTELVTVTIPPETSIGSIRERIAQEHAGAEHIKSDRTRDRVKRALARIQRTLRKYQQTPENGLVIYAGVVDGELVSAVFDDLPAPVAESTYRCDDQFDVTQLVDAVQPGETFGLVVVERGGAAIGRLVGDRVVPVRIFDSQVMGSFRAGGQSAQRFARERERQKHEFFQQVGETATDELVGDEDTVAGLVIGGTLGTAKEFVSKDYLDHRLRDRLLGTYSVEYATQQGLHQLVDRAADQLLNAERRMARDRLGDFYSRLRDDEPVAYGVDEVERAIKFGAVETVLVAASVSRDQRQEIETAVSRQGGECFVISGETEGGRRFADTFGGVGALLRFPVN